MAHAPSDPQLLMEHADFLRRVARGVLRDDADADDAVQDTFVAAMTGGPRQRGALRRWLSSVTWRRAKDIQRREATRRHHESGRPAPRGTPSTAELAERVEVGRMLMTAVLALDDKYRDVLLLRFYEGLPPREVAERLDVPVETVRTRTKRALAMLRERLDDEHEGGRRGWATALAPLAAPAVPSVPLLLPVIVAAALVLSAMGAIWIFGDMGREHEPGVVAAASDDDDPPNPGLEPRGRPSPQDDDAPAAPVPGDQPASPAPPSPALPTRTAPGPDAIAGKAPRPGRADLVVHVVDHDDVAVAGAAVYLVPKEAGPLVEQDDVTELGRTDVAGRFAIQGLPAGMVRCAADYGGNLWSQQGLRSCLDARSGQRVPLIPEAEAEVTIRLPVRIAALATLRGRVTDPAGRPVRGAMVYANGPRVRTDVDGRYRVLGLRPGTHRFAVNKTGHVQVYGDMELQAGTTTERDATLKYQKTGSLSLEGQVVGHDGTPLEDLVVRFEAGAAGYLRTDRTDATGRFGMYDLPDMYASRGFSISAFPTDGHLATKTVAFERVPGDPITITMDPPRVEVTLRVVDDATEIPITAIRYALEEPAPNYPRLHGAESPTGSYTRRLDVGVYPLRIEATGYEHFTGVLGFEGRDLLEHVVRLVPVTDRTPRFDVTFVVRSGKDGSPIEECRFELGPFTDAMGETEPERLPRGKDGRYGWSLPVGAYMLSIFKQGYVAHMAQVLIERDGTNVVHEIALEPEGGPDGNPAWLPVYRNTR